MNNLTTLKIVLGMLITLVLAFSVQVTADALTLKPRSDRITTKEPNDPAFEISFSVGLTGNTTAYNDASPRRRVTDGNTPVVVGTALPNSLEDQLIAVRIDSSGYRVRIVNGQERRLLPSNAVDATLTPTRGTARGITLKSSGSYRTDTNDDDTIDSGDDELELEVPVIPYYVDTSNNVVDSNGKAVYIRTGSGVKSPNSDPYAYTRAKYDPNVPGVNPVPVGYRFDYNEEQISISVEPAANIDIRVKGTNVYPPSATADGTWSNTPNLTEQSGILKSSMTLEFNTQTAGEYTVKIVDSTPAEDFPKNAVPLALGTTTGSRSRRSEMEFTLYVTEARNVTVYTIGALRPTGTGTAPYLRVDTGKDLEQINDDFKITKGDDGTDVLEATDNPELRYKVIAGNGTLYAAADSQADPYRGPNQDLTVHHKALVFLNTNGTTNEVSVSVSGRDRQTHPATIVYEYSGSTTPTTPSTPSTPSPPAQPAPPALTVSTTSISGAPSSAHTLTITTTAPLAQISVNPSTAFRTAGGFASPAIATTTANTYTSTITLPAVANTYTATVNAGTAGRQITIIVGAGSGSQTPTVAVGIQPGSGAPGSTATVTVTATDASGNPAAGVVVTLSITSGGGTLVPSTVTTGTTGTATSALTRGSTAGSNYFITASAFGYTFRSGLTSGERVVISGTSSGTSSGGTVGAAAEVDVYDGNNQDGSLNSRLAEPFIVEVVDANDNPVEDARVRFRTTIGSGRFSPRTPRTDEDGFAETTFTPTSTGRIRVVATVTGVDSTAAFIVQGGEPADALEKVSGDNQSGTPGNALANPFVVEVQDEDGEPLTGHSVTFSVTAGGGSLSATSATADEDGRAETTLTLGSERGVNSVRASVAGADPVIFNTSIDAKILVVAANRPVMYWIAGGGLYSLSGAKEAKIAESANGVAVGGGKIYWTSQVNASSGTINSANLDGTGVATVTSIQSVPVGIAVDTAGSKLYWTNARGRIQSASLNGSGIQNVMQNLSAPTDIVVSNGFIYWTEGGNSVRRVNIRGQKIAIDVAVNLGTVGGLAVGGGKVYWTEQTSASAGTVNGANLNGTNFETLATLQAAPMGISVDTAGSKLYWTNARGRVQSANLNGSMIKTVVEGLISPSKLAIGGSNTETEAMTRQPTAKKDNAKYDVNGDGAVDNTDASLVAAAMNTSNTKYDVNGDGTVNFLDLLLVFDNREDAAAAAPTIVGMKLTAIQIDIIQEQIDLLIATNDRSPAALRTLVYMQQLLATARPEKTQLFANYPNPFNPETWIPYELATDTHVTITIYNTQGVVIRTLQFGHQSAGYYTERDRAAYWDGRNVLGEQVASGLYFYQLETDEMSSMRKMVILK